MSLIEDRLIRLGMDTEDVSEVVSEASFYYSRMNTITSNIRRCTACPLVDQCAGPVAGLGPLRPEIMVISDRPLPEDSSGIVETSVFMMTMLSRIGLKIEDVYWTYAVKCATEQINMDDVRECFQHLHNEMMTLQPAIVITLGSAATSALKGETISVADAMDEPFIYDAGRKDVHVFAMPHPRTLMKLPAHEFRDEMDHIWMHIKQIEEYL